MFDLQKTKKYLLKICTNPQKLKEVSSVQSRKFWFRKGISVILEDNDIENFNKAVEEMRRDEFVKLNFTEKFIEEKLEETISESFKFTEEKRENFIQQELQNLINSFRKEIKEWIFIVPIENLSIARQFIVGDVKFYNFNKDRKKKYEEIERNIIKNNKKYNDDQKKEISELMKKYHNDSNYHLICAEVKVKGIIDYAQQTALQKIRMALNVLKLYSYRNDDSYKRYFGIVGEVVKHDIRRIIRYTEDKKETNTITEKVGSLFWFELDKSRRKFMKKYGFDILDKILKKDNTTDFESRLLASIYWFGEAMNIPFSDSKNEIQEKRNKKHENLIHFKIGDRFIKLFIALESILIFNDNESITNNIAERTALLLEKKYTDRKKIKKIVKDLYKTRSKIVHHSEVFVPRYELIYLTNIVQSVIIYLIKMKDKLNIRTHDDLYEYFEKLKLS